jgi:ASCH domain
MTVALGPRVLSVKQPWAWAIVTGRKRVENRSWSTPYRGTVYIHASGTPDPRGVAWFSKHKIKVPRALPTGAIVGTCELVGIVGRKQGQRFGKWFFGPIGWVVKNPRALARPIAMKGKLGLFRASGKLVRKVEEETPRQERR